MSDPENKTEYGLVSGNAYMICRGGEVHKRSTTIEFSVRDKNCPDTRVYFDIREGTNPNYPKGLSFRYRQKSSQPSNTGASSKQLSVDQDFVLFLLKIYNNAFEDVPSENHLLRGPEQQHFKIPNGIFDVLAWLLGDLNEPIEGSRHRFKKLETFTPSISAKDINQKITDHFIQKHANRTWLRSDKTQEFYWSIIKSNLLEKYDSTFNEILKKEENFKIKEENSAHFSFFKNNCATSASKRALAVHKLLNSKSTKLVKKIILHTIMNHEQDIVLQKQLALKFGMSVGQLRQVIEQDLRENCHMVNSNFTATKQIIIRNLYNSNALENFDPPKSDKKNSKLVKNVYACCVMPEKMVQIYSNKIKELEEIEGIEKFKYKWKNPTRFNFLSREFFQTESYQKKYTIQIFGYNIKSNTKKYSVEEKRFSIIKELLTNLTEPMEKKMLIYSVLHSSEDKQWNDKIIEHFGITKPNVVKYLKSDLIHNHEISIHDLNATKQIILDIIDAESMERQRGSKTTLSTDCCEKIRDSMKENRASYNSDIEKVKRFFGM